MLTTTNIHFTERDRGESKRLMVITDDDKLSVKKLIEEEMIMDQDEIKDHSNAEVELNQSRRHEDPVKMDSKRRKKSHKKSHDMDNHDLNSDVTLNPKIFT
ncbi:hypothetical protein RJT34_02150 [Clitoria ternatea]|uniref:Uncharacterized protein n=1 Tax=Clitoria ternatea TaxID=43366 RepID=A0AAN9PYV3_CLITE